ncbi:CTP synthase C-terminal region-related (seleno)protein [Methylomonas rosea]|uniref:CTP synthase (glutamine hydrolyzing) n=1 Tax=Methylomonas rosea TaxID=2952227 RepID=A0ABT1TWA5_9GAMM|nr:CTP synthase [Methylomonas sp. WSC-7]MCQ8118868.1 CTP synthase [Methylomonas sp. WSC-7]
MNGKIKSIALLGEFTPSFPPHLATNAAIEHAKAAVGLDINADWVSTADIDQTLFERYAGLWVAPGSPYKNLDNTLAAIRYARENGIPCFGTCGGFQHMILEYARNVLGFKDAQHAEYDPYASNLFISQLTCSLAGRALPLTFEPGSRAAEIYGALSATEQYYCNFGINPEFIEILKQGPLRISGADVEGEIRVIEWPGHPFFIGTLFVPQARSTPEQPHPLVSAFLNAVANL